MCRCLSRRLIVSERNRFAPWGDVAYRVNLFSAVMAALTIGLVYVAGKSLAGNRLAAVVGALCLAVGFTFWSQVIIAEVYSAGAAFLTAAMVCVLLWYRTGSHWAILLAGLLGGAGLGAHGSLAPLELAVVIFLLINLRRWREWLAPEVIGAGVGLAIYVGGVFLVDANEAPANIFTTAYTPSRSKWVLSATDVEDRLRASGFWSAALSFSFQVMSCGRCL